MYEIFKFFALIVLFFGIIILISYICNKVKRQKGVDSVLEQDRNDCENAIKNKEKYIEIANNYKERNPDWDKEPDYTKLEKIYAIEYIHIAGPNRILCRFCCFENLSFTNTKIIAQYAKHISRGVIKGEQWIDRVAEIEKEYFNKTWFVSRELATLEILNRIEKGYLRVINLQPIYCGINGCSY